jgi:hypothetical protein
LASAAGGERMAIPGIVDHSPQVTDLEPCLELAGLRWRFDCPEYSGGPPQPGWRSCHHGHFWHINASLVVSLARTPAARCD